MLTMSSEKTKITPKIQKYTFIRILSIHNSFIIEPSPNFMSKNNRELHLRIPYADAPPDTFLCKCISGPP